MLVSTPSVSNCKLFDFFELKFDYSSYSKICAKYHCRCLDPAVRTPTSNVACFLVPDIDAGFILVPATGPYVQQEGVRGHCIILHPECL